MDLDLTAFIKAISRDDYILDVNLLPENLEPDIEKLNKDLSKYKEIRQGKYMYLLRTIISIEK